MAESEMTTGEGAREGAGVGVAAEVAATAEVAAEVPAAAAEVAAEVPASAASGQPHPQATSEYDPQTRAYRQIGQGRAAFVHDMVKDAQLSGIEKRYAYRLVKRLFDIVFSLVVLVAFSWLFAIIAIAVKLDTPGPVFFKQTRVGRNGREFTMYKFRSMCDDAEARLGELLEQNEKNGPVFKIADDPRITRVGRILRQFSLDELPQFVNVFKGDISVVGPRPALPSEVATYTPYQRQRLLVPQGITCYWQTRRNRDFISFEEWVDWDLLYVRECGVWADFKLIIQTIGVVLSAQGS